MSKGHWLCLVVIPAVLAACGGGENSFDDRANVAPPKVRLVHAVPGGPNVSLFRDNQAQAADVTNMPYKGASNYFETDRGTHAWEVRTATNPSVTVGNQTFETSTGKKYTLIAVPDSGSLTALALVADPFSKSLISDNARVRVFNAAFNAANLDAYITAPATDINTVGPTLAGAAYKQPVPVSGANSLEFEGGNYTLRLTVAGSKTVLFTAPISVPKNADWLLVPVPASVTPRDVKVLLVQSDTGTPATELMNQP